VNFIINQCRWIDNNPKLAINFSNKTLDAQFGVNGQVIIQPGGNYGLTGGSIPMQTRFYAVDNNTALQSNEIGFSGTRSYNAEIQVTITGNISDNAIYAVFVYRGLEFGRSTLRLLPKIQYGGYGNQYGSPYGGGYGGGQYGGYPYGGYPYGGGYGGYRPY
jgi:hypothetical protein